MKKCTKCGAEKELSKFPLKSKRKDGSLTYGSWCKECQRSFAKLHYINNKEMYALKARKNQKKTDLWFSKIKHGKVCSICGENRWWVLEFHHRDKSQKDIEVSLMRKRGFGRSRILCEIAKCDVVCANCHRNIHHQELHKMDGEAAHWSATSLEN